MGARKGTVPWNAGKGKGWTNPRGYRVVSMTVDGKRRQVTEHRYVMEQHLGRLLEPTELVHHKDGNTLNNSIENLEVMTVTTHNLHHHVGTKRPDSLKRSAALFQQLTQEIQRLKSDRADLLAVLHEVASHLEEMAKDNPRGQDAFVLEGVRAAIAKATGGAR